MSVPESEHLGDPMPLRDTVDEYVAAFLSEPWELSEDTRAQLAEILHGA